MTDTKTQDAASLPASRRKQYSAPALEKGLDILELLSREPDGLNISQITQKLNLSVGKLFRMLVVLEQRGYIASPAGSDSYRLSLKMFNLSHQFPPVKILTSAAAPILRSLSMMTEQSCHLVVYYEGKGHVVAQQDAPSARVFTVRLGAEAPLMKTCSGHVLLAFSGPEHRRHMLEKAPSHHPSADASAVDGIVRRVAKKGYERIKSTQAKGVEDIGYPIFDHNGQVTAAMVIPFLSYVDESHPVEIDKAQSLLQQAAAELSEKLGYTA